MGQSERGTRRAFWQVAIVLVLLLAAGLRLHLLGAQSLWNDEGASVAMTGRSLSEIISNTAADIHPPGYYILLSVWTRLMGSSEFALRLMSALQGVLTVALTYALGRRLFGRDAGVWAALLLAVNTFAIYYAQETRMYAQLGLFAVAGMWALLLWLTGARDRLLFALALVNAGGLFTQYAYPLTMIAQGIVFLLWWFNKRDVRALGRYAAANVVTLALFAPWAGEAVRQVSTWPNSGAGTPPDMVLAVLSYGLTARNGLDFFALFGVLVFAAMGLWLNRTRPLLLLPAIWAAVPVGAFLLLGLQPDDMKQLMPAAVAVALWLGAGAAVLWRDDCITPRALAIAGSAVMALTLIQGLPPLYSSADFARNDYRSMAEMLAASGPEDAIILNGPGQGEVWSYYYRGGAAVYPLPRDLGGDDRATRAEMEAILQAHRRISVLFWGDAERDPNRIVESTLDAGAFEVGSQWVRDVRFVTYVVQGEAATTPEILLDKRFGEDVVLQGYALDRESCRPGDALTLTLFWTTDAPLEARYKVFVHLYTDASAPPPAQHDSEPGGGMAPTVDWQVGETIIDRHGILIPADLAPGTYSLAVGVYDAADPASRLASDEGERLVVASVVIE